MSDGNKIAAKVASDDKEEIDDSIDLLLRQMKKHRYMVVGFDMELFPERTYGRNTTTLQPRIALLTLCTGYGCVLIRLHKNFSESFALKKLAIFVANKDIEGLVMLQHEWGLKIRNAVELSELAVSVLGRTSLATFGVRKLASFLEVLRLDQRPLKICWKEWDGKELSKAQIKCAAIDAYASYSIGKKLLEE